LDTALSIVRAPASHEVTSSAALSVGIAEKLLEGIDDTVSVDDVVMKSVWRAHQPLPNFSVSRDLIDYWLTALEKREYLSVKTIYSAYEVSDLMSFNLEHSNPGRLLPTHANLGDIALTYVNDPH
jgi:hypothetical protein